MASGPAGGVAPPSVTAQPAGAIARTTSQGASLETMRRVVVVVPRLVLISPGSTLRAARAARRLARAGDRVAQERQDVGRHAPAFLLVGEAGEDELVDPEAPVGAELRGDLLGVADDRRAEVHAHARDP